MLGSQNRTDGVFDVLIIGGGNAGISVAARLLNKGIGDVAVIESQAVHTYRPLLSYVGGGQASMRTAERTQRSVTPRGCTWLRDSATDVDAGTKTVTCASGKTYRYRDLIVCAGLVPDTEALPGIYGALDSPAVASNYLNAADKTWALVQSMPTGGRAVFTVPRPPVSCTGTTVKPLFLAAAHWKKAGRLPGITITLLVDRPHLLDVPALNERLQRYLDELDVQVLYGTTVTAINPDSKSLTVTDPAGATQQMSYDMLHLVPPFRGPDWMTASGLTSERSHGLVDIDSRTLRHRVHPDIWAAGDGAAVDTDPSGGALRQQISILVGNLMAARNGAPLADYDGYTVAPVAVAGHRLILGEFDRKGVIQSRIPSVLDPLKPRRTAWAVDRYGLPQVYWNLILNGRL